MKPLGFQEVSELQVQMLCWECGFRTPSMSPEPVPGGAEQHSNPTPGGPIYSPGLVVWHGGNKDWSGISGPCQCLWLGMPELGLVWQHRVFGAGTLLRGSAQLYPKNRLGWLTARLSWAWRVIPWGTGAGDSPAPPGEGTLLSPRCRGP